jgi:hypothetical protein
MANNNQTLASPAGARQSGRAADATGIMPTAVSAPKRGDAGRAGAARAKQTPPSPVSADGDEDMRNPSPTLILTKLDVENYDRLLEQERTGRRRAGKPLPARRLWPWLIVLAVLAVGAGILGALTSS